VRSLTERLRQSRSAGGLSRIFEATKKASEFSRRSRFTLLLASIASILLAGCQLPYLARVAYIEAHLLWNRRPINQLLREPDLAADERQRLETVLQVRQFAANRLGLRVGGAYQTVSAVDQNAVVWVLMASPRDALSPYLWWFPIVGYVPYRGYFSRAGAEAAARAMQTRGYDTFIRPAIAFSSLGFFNDPVFSNLLQLSRPALVGVLIHELFHRTFFLKNEVMFDESSANWIGNRGAIDFFVETEGPGSQDAIAAREIYVSDMKFAAFLLQQQIRLIKLYESGLPRQEILKRRVRLFAEIKADYVRLKPRLSGLERFDLDQQELNNAVLMNYLIYFHDLNRFAALERIHRGDTRATIRAIIELAGSEPHDPFHALWKATSMVPGAQDPADVSGIALQPTLDIGLP